MDAAVRDEQERAHAHRARAARRIGVAEAWGSGLGGVALAIAAYAASMSFPALERFAMPSLGLGLAAVLLVAGIVPTAVALAIGAARTVDAARRLRQRIVHLAIGAGAAAVLPVVLVLVLVLPMVVLGPRMVVDVETVTTAGVLAVLMFAAMAVLGGFSLTIGELAWRRATR